MGMNKNDLYKKVIMKKINPNQTYSLIYASIDDKNHRTENGEELITDGDIIDLTYSYKEEYYEQEYDNSKMHFKSGSAVVEIANASYTIIQKIKDKAIECAEVYTTTEDNEYFNKILISSNIKYTSESSLIKKQEPHVRKIILKK